PSKSCTCHCHSRPALSHSQTCGQGNAQHHDQAEQDLTHSASGVEVSMNEAFFLWLGVHCWLVGECADGHWIHLRRLWTLTNEWEAPSCGIAEDDQCRNNMPSTSIRLATQWYRVARKGESRQESSSASGLFP